MKLFKSIYPIFYYLLFISWCFASTQGTIKIIDSNNLLIGKANYIKEQFATKYKLREMALIPNKRSALEEEMQPGDIKFESVDQIVTEQIINIDSEFYDNKLLLEIYRSL